MTDTRLPVVIVGAGPAGAALALLLAERGIPVTLLERHADFDREFRGEGLQPSGLACLRQMGLADELAALPQCRAHTLRIVAGRTTVEVDAQNMGADEARLVSQPPLLEMLTRKAAAHAGFSLRMGARARALVHQGDRVTGVQVEHAGGSEELAAALVIGADGRSSLVRKRAGIELASIDQTFDVLWARGDLGDFLPADGMVHMEILRDGGNLVVFPSPLGGQQIGVVIRKGGFRDLREQGADQGLAWVAERCSTGLAGALGRATNMGRPVLLDVICGRAARWTRPGLLLLGDAAHPMSPVGGQGINMALRDAIVAANHLVPVLRGPADPAALDAATARIEAERLSDILPAQAMQTREARNLRRRNALELALVPYIIRLAPLLQWIFRRRRRLRHGFTRVELRV
jgi:2-polyprenyl-6-methoxyphenol hydroxylase-like FAD-dependent oxidoreductase